MAALSEDELNTIEFALRVAAEEYHKMADDSTAVADALQAGSLCLRLPKVKAAS